jgi:hypothetical protein
LNALLVHQLGNFQKLIVMHQLFLVIQQEVKARDMLSIGKQGVSDIETGNLSLFLSRAKICKVGVENAEFVQPLSFLVYRGIDFKGILLAIKRL